jgi:hypothetical protein
VCFRLITGKGWQIPERNKIPYLDYGSKRRKGCYLAATRSLDKALTGLGSEIIIRVPQTEQ